MEEGIFNSAQEFVEREEEGIILTVHNSFREGGGRSL
jgi:hypothetical protein